MEYFYNGTDIKCTGTVVDADGTTLELTALVDLVFTVKSVNNTVLETYKLSEATVKDSGDNENYYFNIENTVYTDQRQIIVCGEVKITDADLSDNIRNVVFTYEKITIETC